MIELRLSLIFYDRFIFILKVIIIKTPMMTHLLMLYLTFFCVFLKTFLLKKDHQLNSNANKMIEPDKVESHHMNQLGRSRCYYLLHSVTIVTNKSKRDETSSEEYEMPIISLQLQQVETTHTQLRVGIISPANSYVIIIIIYNMLSFSHKSVHRHIHTVPDQNYYFY